MRIPAPATRVACVLCDLEKIGGGAAEPRGRGFDAGDADNDALAPACVVADSEQCPVMQRTVSKMLKEEFQCALRAHTLRRAQVTKL
jgi:hypothetical protein